MNKKTLFLALLGIIIIVPTIAYAGALCDSLKTVRQLSLQIGGSIVAIGWIVAGILYLTSAGGSRMETAKKALIAAVIGTVLVLLSQGALTLIQDAINAGNVNQCV